MPVPLLALLSVALLGVRLLLVTLLSVALLALRLAVPLLAVAGLAVLLLGLAVGLLAVLLGAGVVLRCLVLTVTLVISRALSLTVSRCGLAVSRLTAIRLAITGLLALTWGNILLRVARRPRLRRIRRLLPLLGTIDDGPARVRLVRCRRSGGSVRRHINSHRGLLGAPRS
ncbi:hypothetical protein Misp01_01660 [Microtetraspora sp. NBRC 13810]|nr:hypothetical protein Misp01_01660 [Microtetraspora sp. NBRC 13810]